jgi:hypothetical protein
MRSDRKWVQEMFREELSRRLKWGRVAALLLIVGVALGMSGCGAGSSSLPPGLVSAGSVGTFSISSTSVPDSITGRSYNAAIATTAGSVRLASGQTDFVAGCVLSGNIPAGLSARPGAVSPYDSTECLLVLAAGNKAAPGKYNFSLAATDSTSPPTTFTVTYTLTVRPEFTFTTAALAQGVSGR